ncbi:hypothetical protein [Streptomyces sp. TRM64462]|uniref:hypothetical protein n=1 Tax=Streptomyces sp. TRM64462 TaxID=2741726 RepID=UPI001586CC71|nr:hypothetical protein [Streptomyces sp. TRM64462]
MPRRAPTVGERDPLRAVAAGLLNLSCLGLGYAVLRHWWSAAVCWLATGGLLFAALPAEPDGVPQAVLVAYGLFLLAVAVDGARRGLRTRLAVPAARARWVALVAAFVLLAVPAAGAFAYGGAREEARQQELLARLASLDALVAQADDRDFDAAEHTYLRALRGYAELGTEHAGSRAAKLVPDRLDAYYEAVSAPYKEGEYCDAIAPLRHLRAVPDTVDRRLLGDLVSRPDEPLAHAWRECGMAGLGRATATREAGAHLKDLLTTFPRSEHARQVEPAVRERIRTRSAALSGASPCPVSDELSRIRTTVAGLPDATARALRTDAEGAVRKGLYACGLDQFKDRKFSSAKRSMTRYAERYPSSANAARARQIAVAAEIAAKRPAAGRSLPPVTVPSGTRLTLVVTNDGPGAVDILYTGPVTGTASIKACAGCSTYASRAAGRTSACKSPSRSYPTTTLRLPPGEYHFLYKHARTAATAGFVRSYTDGAKIQSGYRYTMCLYVFRGAGLTF